MRHILLVFIYKMTSVELEELQIRYLTSYALIEYIYGIFSRVMEDMAYQAVRELFIRGRG